MLTKLKDLLKPRRNSGLPYGITPGQLARLKALRSYAEWQDYRDLIDTITTVYMEQSLVAPDQRHHLSDMVLGLRKAGSVIDEIILQVEQDLERGDRRSSRDREHSRQREQLATYGTGFWGSGA